MANNRFYNFNFISYNYDELIKYLEFNHIKYSAFILHDKDVKDNGEPKEPHFHCIITFKNARSYNAVLNELKKNFTCNILCEITEDLQASLDYLTHTRDPTKYQYEKSHVVSTYLDNETSNKAYEIICDFLSSSCKPNYIELVKKYGREVVINFKHYDYFAWLCDSQRKCQTCNNDYLVRKSTGEVLEQIKLF